jgi:multiple antibiotic resistance protein
LTQEWYDSGFSDHILTEIFSAAVVFFLIMDPLGNIPVFMSVLRRVDPARHLRITVRELLIAYVILLMYLFGGRYILDFLHLSQEAISISGGIILFLIAIRMIFPSPEGLFGDTPEGEPFIVPLAIPAVAGPSIMAVLMLMSTTTPTMDLLMAISGAWVAAAVILLAATPMHRLLGQRGLTAIERLMGMILVMMSVQMMLNAIKTFDFT